MRNRSPWERALGTRFGELDPRLHRYFAAIPQGSVGRGHGTFHTLGTPRRWLWPVLAILAMDGVLFPVWERSVRFTVENRATSHGTVMARRTFHLDSGDRVMFDEIGLTRHGLVDRLGRHGTVSARLDPSIVDGRLQLRSTSASLRFGAFRIPLGPLSPRVTLLEQTVGDLQRVSLTLDVALLGRIYEYQGSFTYAVEAEGETIG